MTKVSDKNVIVTGVLGQTGSYMAEMLLEKGYKVYGLARPRTSGLDVVNISGITEHENFKLLELDICEHVSMSSLISNLQPEFFFHFAALSHVRTSFDIPVETFRVNAEATIAQLQAIKEFSPSTKYYFAATSELFGGLTCPETGYTEETPFHPRSPYAVSKLAAFYAVQNFREAYGLSACSGILHNHESPRRANTFATRKITQGVANIVSGNQTKLTMGDLSSFRDIGHAKDYCEAIWLMMNQDEFEDYVVGTGAGATIQEMFDYVCSLGGLEPKDVYELDERFCRPSEVPYLRANPAKIKSLGWNPKYDWKSLLKEMYEHDLGLVTKQSLGE